MGARMSDDFQTSTIRTARKQHTCGECRETIQPGEKYKLWSGKGDGGMYSHKMCSAVCDAANDVAWDYVRASQFMDDDDGPQFGGLLSWLSESPPEPLPPLHDPQPDTKTLDMFPGLPPVKRERTRRETIQAYGQQLKEYLHANYRLVDGWRWVQKDGR